MRVRLLGWRCPRRLSTGAALTTPVVLPAGLKVTRFLNFTVEGFRCFREPTTFSDAGKLSFLAGANNSGKSALMLPLRRLTTPHYPVEEPFYGTSRWSGDELSIVRFVPDDISYGSERLKVTFHEALEGLVLATRRQNSPPLPSVPAAVLEGTLQQRYHTGALRMYCNSVKSVDCEYIDDDEQPGRITFSALLSEFKKSICYIPDKRQLSNCLSVSECPRRNEETFDGALGLPLLLKYATPPRRQADVADEYGQRIESICTAFSRLLGTRARVHPVAGERDIQLEIDGSISSYRDLGAGLEQLLILAVASVEYPRALLIVEEPELFLHPTLQRRLAEFFLERDGPTICTTHSNHLLDIKSDDVAYFRTYVDSRANTSRVERVSTTKNHTALWDLGVRPSSLFESNATIWVEGPSDAILLRAWLSLLEGFDLTEGLHFSFNFHAGSLLHKYFLDLEDEDAMLRSPERIVNMYDVHPNVFVVADSDGNAKQTIGHPYLSSFLEHAPKDAPIWITAGKEVENYLPDWVFRRYLVDRSSPRVPFESHTAVDEATLRWSRFWEIINETGSKKVLSGYPNKVGFASWASLQLHQWREVEYATDPLEVLDLRDRLVELAEFIREKSA